MKRLTWFLGAFFLLGASVQLPSGAQPASKEGTSRISWKKIVLDKNFRAEGVGVADVNKDGKLDVIVGDCWYEAPKDTGGEWKRHIIREYYDGKQKKIIPADRKYDLLVYSDSFCCFPDDFNGDGWVDVIVIPFPGRDPCYWYENPGEKGGLWKQHLLTNSACNETPIFVDLFKTGKKHLVMGWNPPKNPAEPTKGNLNNVGEMCYFVPGKDPTKPWERISISGPVVNGKGHPGTNPFSHGLGAGDVNSDGRLDVICADGWWEQPAKQDGSPWKFHGAKIKITDPCSDMYVLDIDGDGKNDIISSSAHYWGFWWSQQKDANTFVQRTLFPSPFDVAKLPSTLQLAEEERRLFDAVNEVRKVHFSRSPFAAHPELCAMARDHAERIAKSNAKEENIGGKYPGKVLAVKTMRVMPPAEVKVDKKDKKKAAELTPMQKLALSMMPHNEKDADLVLPGFEIGVGTAKLASGEVQYTFVIGDRGQFSLPSQTHALHMVDINGDGMMDLVTGRRWWAHGPRGDDGANDPAQLYWFEGKKNREGMIGFTPHLIDSDSGVGTSFAIADMNGDRLLDIIVSNKKGVHVFLQQR